jgi:SAM-dependent methyltransferase
MKRQSAPRYLGFDTRIEFPTPELAMLLALGHRGRVLELGCGHGTEALFLGAHGCEVLGIDNSRLAIKTANERRASGPAIVRRNVSFRCGDALTYRDTKPGTYAMVLERLLFQNLFWREGDRRTVGSYARMRARLFAVAAFALEPGGLFVLRFRPHQTEMATWGRMVVPSIRDEDAEVASRYFDFDEANEIGFQGMVTPVAFESDLLALESMRMSVLIMRRKDTPPPRGRSR